MEVGAASELWYATLAAECGKIVYDTLCAESPACWESVSSNGTVDE